ncbi:hypothetical protein O996_02658 [Enterococcus faecalis BM4654]|nr:hypothetical protein O996_02658 [Enterococcus faecalis BM4654]
MENNILILINLVLCFLLGYVVDKRKYLKAISAAINYELKLPTYLQVITKKDGLTV